LLLLGAALAASPALAQDPVTDPPTTGDLTLIGEVRDALTEAPIPDASVSIEELGRIVLTDRNGFFQFDSLPAGTWTFRTEHLGYEPNVEASTIGPGNLLLVRLEPRPIELEGLYAEVLSRMRIRRAGAPSQVWAWDRKELSKAVAPDIGRFVKTRGVIVWVNCSNESDRAADVSLQDLPNCFYRKGTQQKVIVWLDDVPLPGAVGTSTLWSMDPRALWAVEFLPDCRQLRIYTTWYMEAVQEGRTRMHPSLLCL
jgi:hypothetical protein